VARRDGKLNPVVRIQISTPVLGEEELNELKQSIISGWLTQGPKVKAFEESFAEYHRVDYALATTSCTTALHLMLAAAGIGPGDEVIVPSFTWVSTANAVLYSGATPVLSDVDPVTYNIDLNDLLSKITPKTKAIIVVHLFGLCVDIPKIRNEISNNILIFEDAACAAGASLGNTPVGGLGEAAAFSFHPRKSITTGEGGMLTTNNSEIAIRASKLRNHGAEISEEERHHGPQPYILPEFNLLGFNYRMTDIQGAIGLVQLSKLKTFIKQREEFAQIYDSELKNQQWLNLPARPTAGQHAWQSYVIRINGANAGTKRNKLMEHMEKNDIATRPGTHAIHSLGYYQNLLQLSDNDFPGSALCRDATIALPLHNKMMESDLERIIQTLKSSGI
jgi:perosamine synthetase